MPWGAPPLELRGHGGRVPPQWLRRRQPAYFASLEASGLRLWRRRQWAAAARRRLRRPLRRPAALLPCGPLCGSADFWRSPTDELAAALALWHRRLRRPGVALPPGLRLPPTPAELTREFFRGLFGHRVTLPVVGPDPGRVFQWTVGVGSRSRRRFDLTLVGVVAEGPHRRPDGVLELRLPGAGQPPPPGQRGVSWSVWNGPPLAPAAAALPESWGRLLGGLYHGDGCLSVTRDAGGTIRRAHFSVVAEIHSLEVLWLLRGMLGGGGIYQTRRSVDGRFRSVHLFSFSIAGHSRLRPWLGELGRSVADPAKRASLVAACGFLGVPLAPLQPPAAGAPDPAAVGLFLADGSYGALRDPCSGSARLSARVVLKGLEPSPGVPLGPGITAAPSAALEGLRRRFGGTLQWERRRSGSWCWRITRQPELLAWVDHWRAVEAALAPPGGPPVALDPRQKGRRTALVPPLLALRGQGAHRPTADRWCQWEYAGYG